MDSNDQSHQDAYPLSSEQQMLLHIRDTLYEGNWDDFVRDLESRAQGRPHVFETVPQSPTMNATIAGHLELIRDMRAWETQHGRLVPPAEAPHMSAEQDKRLQG